MVEIQASIAKPACIPVNHHKNTIFAGKLNHLFIHFATQFLRNDADCVAYACNDPSVIPKLHATAPWIWCFRKGLFHQVVQMASVPLNETCAGKIPYGSMLFAEIDELFVEIDANCVAKIILESPHKFAGATSHLDQRYPTTTQLDVLANCFYKLIGVRYKLPKVSLVDVDCIPPHLYSNLLPLVSRIHFRSFRCVVHLREIRCVVQLRESTVFHRSNHRRVTGQLQ
mmetsp:Transcript_60320/g.113860  ORF Transcript_60320/g.113860 Transcript_60320/m.113860 type:complete len:227 (+) Transcript_60320:570-1250(+)